jgi:hypothetical protein
LTPATAATAAVCAALRTTVAGEGGRPCGVTGSPALKGVGGCAAAAASEGACLLRPRIAGVRAAPDGS